MAQATGKFQNLFIELDGMISGWAGKMVRWKVTWLQLANGHAPLQELRPGTVAIERLQQDPWGQGLHLWPPEKKQRQSRRGRATGKAKVLNGAEAVADATSADQIQQELASGDAAHAHVDEEAPFSDDEPGDAVREAGGDSPFDWEDDMLDDLLDDLLARAPVVAEEPDAIEQPGEPEGGVPSGIPMPGVAEPVAEAPVAEPVAQPPVADAPHVRGAPGRIESDLVFLVPGGAIKFYGRGQQNMVAECEDPAHAIGSACKKTRTVKPGNKPSQGRPLGHLMAWLAGHEMHAFPSKADHFEYKPSFDERVNSRNFLDTLPGAASVLALERPRRDGESAEPDLLP